MWKLVLVFAFFSVGVFCEDAPQANLIVYKSLPSREMIASKDTVVSIRLFNVGGSTAHEISLDDNNWKGFEVVSGSVTGKWERLQAGGSLNHTFTVRAKSAGPFEGNPAKVTFRQSTKGAEAQVVLSNYLPKVEIESLSSYERRTDPHYKEWAIFFLLALLATVPAGYVYQQTAAQQPKSTKKSA